MGAHRRGVCEVLELRGGAHDGRRFTVTGEPPSFVVVGVLGGVAFPMPVEPRHSRDRRSLFTASVPVGTYIRYSRDWSGTWIYFPKS